MKRLFRELGFLDENINNKLNKRRWFEWASILEEKAGTLIFITKGSGTLEEWGLKKVQVNPVRIDSDPGRW